MTSETGSAHKGRNIAIGAIIGAVLVIVLILSVRAIVEKRRENAREAAHTGTAVSRTTRTGASGGAGGASGGTANQGSASGAAVNQGDGSQPIAPGSDQDGANPPADQPDNQVEPPPDEPDNGPIVFTPVSVVSQSVTPNPAAQADFIWCTAEIRGNAASVSMFLDGPENYNFALSLWSTEGDITTWKYNQNAMPPGSYAYSVTATAADGTSTTVAGGTLVTTP